LDRHQGEVTTSQLGWHPAEPTSYVANLKEKFIKKRGKNTRGGTRPKSSKNKETTKKQKKTKQKKETANRNFPLNLTVFKMEILS